jgi:predicted metal-dependent hydrolase
MDRDLFQRGLLLFNGGDYFDAHEAWEDVWRTAPAEEKKCLQGLIQVAVALHHHSRGNLEGARSLLARALRNLTDSLDSCVGVDVAAVRKDIEDCQKALDNGGPCHFQIEISEKS